MDAAGEVALEAAQRTFLRLAFGFLASEVLLGGRVVLGAGNGDDVQCMVELTVTAAVESVLGALPRGARDRGGSGLQREGGLGAESLVAGGVTDQDRRRQCPAASLGQQLGSAGGDELSELAVQSVDLAVEGAQVRQLLARDPGPRAGCGQVAQVALDALQCARLVQRAALQRGLELGAQLEQVPANAVHGPGALGHEIAAVIEQPPDLHRPLVQERDRELPSGRSDWLGSASRCSRFWWCRV